MKKPTKFSFKTNKPTGRYRSFHATTVDIKIKGRQVGTIFDRPCKIRLMVKDETNFKWVLVKHRPKDFDDAKQWLNDNFEYITQLDLHYLPKGA